MEGRVSRDCCWKGLGVELIVNKLWIGAKGRVSNYCCSAVVQSRNYEHNGGSMQNDEIQVFALEGFA